MLSLSILFCIFYWLERDWLQHRQRIQQTVLKPIPTAMPAFKNLQEIGTISFLVEWYLVPQKQSGLWLQARRRRNALKGWSTWGRSCALSCISFGEPHILSQLMFSVPKLPKKVKRKIKIPLKAQAQTWWLIWNGLSYNISPFISHLIPYFLCTPWGWESLREDHQFIDSLSNFRTYWSSVPASWFLGLFFFFPFFYEMYCSINLKVGGTAFTVISVLLRCTDLGTFFF